MNGIILMIVGTLLVLITLIYGLRLFIKESKKPNFKDGMDRNSVADAETDVTETRTRSSKKQQERFLGRAVSAFASALGIHN